MTVSLARSILAGLLSALVLGCGGNGSKLLSATDAAGLKDTLGQVRSAVSARDCQAATARLRELRSDVSNLDGSVDRRLRIRLREEIVGKLAPAVASECDDSKTETVPTTTTPAPTTPTEPTTPEPTPSTPSTETTPPPEPPADTVPVPPAETTPPTTPAPAAPAPDPGGANGGTATGGAGG